jgi:hypothetical protein
VKKSKLGEGVPIGHGVEGRFGVANDSQPPIHETIPREPDHFGRKSGTRPGE